MQAQDILHVWFEELSDKQHFTKDPALDEAMRSRFGATLAAASRGELFTWRTTAPGRLAEILVLDQFTRNIFRDTPQAFGNDPMALVLAQELVANGQDRNLPLPQRCFAYMPFMHSESLPMQEQAVQLFGQPGMEGYLDSALRHKAIIERFERFPHRNQILGRASSTPEIAFLSERGSSF